jgi:hypothetical protein
MDRLSLRVDLFDLAEAARERAESTRSHWSVMNVGVPVVTPSGNAHAYYYSTRLSDLYLVEGLK